MIRDICVALVICDREGDVVLVGSVVGVRGVSFIGCGVVVEIPCPACEVVVSFACVVEPYGGVGLCCCLVRGKAGFEWEDGEVGCEEERVVFMVCECDVDGVGSGVVVGVLGVLFCGVGSISEVPVPAEESA